MYLRKNASTVVAILWMIVLSAALCTLISLVVFFDNGFEGNILAVPIIVLMGLFFLITFLSGIIRTVRFMRAAALNKYFQSDADGIVTIADLTKYMNRNETIVTKTVEELVDSCYFVNLNYDKKNKAFYLSDRKNVTAGTNDSRRCEDASFVGIHCPGCSATLKVRTNLECSCPTCGRKIKVPRIIVRKED